MSSTRIEYIDRLKGFAILCVIMGHYVFHVLGQSDIIAELIGSFQMPLFFFLSGYVISSEPSIKKCGRKIISFILPMVVIGGTYAMFSGGTLLDWVQTPFKYGYWYLYVLSVFYFLLFFVGKASNIWAKGVISIVIFVMIVVLDCCLPHKWNDIFSIWMLKQYWIFFVVAFFLRQKQMVQSVMKNNFIFSLCLIGYIVGFIFYIEGFSHLFYLNAFCFIFAAFYVISTTQEKNNRVTFALNYFGKHTLEIYVIHFYIIHLTSLEDVGDWLTNTGNFFIEILSGIAYSVVLAYICILISKLLRMSKFIDNMMFGSFTKNNKLFR